MVQEPFGTRESVVGSLQWDKCAAKWRGRLDFFYLREGRDSKPVPRLVVDRGEGVLQVAYGLALVTLEACACQPFGHLC